MLHLLTHKAAACLALVIVAFSTPPTLLAETPVQAAAVRSKSSRPHSSGSIAGASVIKCWRRELKL